jgi:hypothetical protein
MSEINEISSLDLNGVLAQIGAFARKHNVSPQAVSDIFNAGLVASHVLAPGLINTERLTEEQVEARLYKPG